MSALSTFDPTKASRADLPVLPRYSEEAIITLLVHYGVEKAAETINAQRDNQGSCQSENIPSAYSEPMKLQLKLAC